MLRGAGSRVAPPRALGAGLVWALVPGCGGGQRWVCLSGSAAPQPVWKQPCRSVAAAKGLRQWRPGAGAERGLAERRRAAPHPSSLGWGQELDPAKPQTLSPTRRRAKLTCPGAMGLCVGAQVPPAAGGQEGHLSDAPRASSTSSGMNQHTEAERGRSAPFPSCLPSPTTSGRPLRAPSSSLLGAWRCPRPAGRGGGRHDPPGGRGKAEPKRLSRLLTGDTAAGPTPRTPRYRGAHHGAGGGFGGTREGARRRLSLAGLTFSFRAGKQAPPKTRRAFNQETCTIAPKLV